MERDRFLVGLLAICAAALVLRLAAVLLIPTQPVADYWSYLRRAENLLGLGVYGVRPGRADATWMPGYPLVLAVALAITGRSLLGAKMLNVLFGVAGVALVGLCGRRLAGDRVGLVAAAIAAFLPRLVLLPCLLASENLFLPLLLLWLLILAGSWENLGLRRAVMGGIVVGLATLARAAGYLLGLASPLAGLLAGRRLRRVLVEALVVLAAQHAVMLPWALRNRASMGELSFLTTSAGMTLYMGNNPAATGRWYQARREIAEVTRRTGPATGFERDRRFRREALRWIAANPRAAAALYARKLGWLFRGEEIAEALTVAEWDVPRHALPRGAPPLKVRALLEEHPLQRHPGWLALPAAAGHWLLLALEAAGCVVLARWAYGRASGPERARWRWMTGAFLGTALYLVALGALFHGDPRFRWPASDALIPVAALAVAQATARGPGAEEPEPA